MAVNPRPKLFETKNKNTTVALSVGNNTNSPALRSVNKNSGKKLDALRRKLVKDPNPQPVDAKTRINPDNTYIESISQDTGMSVAEARGLLDSLSDLELSKQIIVSSILSPNDMLKTELIYGCSTDFFGEVSQPLVEVIKDYFDNTYKIKKLLPEMIGKAIFTDGAYPMAIFPESIIDSAINNNLKISKESAQFFDKKINKPLGILGNPDRNYQNPRLPKRSAILSSSFESFSQEEYSFDPIIHNKNIGLTVTDNPLILRAPKVMAKIAKNNILNKYGQVSYSAEFYAGIGFGTDNKKQLDTTTIYPSRASVSMPLLDMSTIESDKDNFGHPVVFSLPTEAVIPVYEPGSPHIHIGYFIALDESGNPLSTADYDDQFKDLQMKTKQAGSSGSSNSYGTGGTSTVSSYASYKDVASSVLGSKDLSMMNAEEAAKQYAAIVEAELEQRLKNGDYNEKHTVAKATRIYRMMFTRACQTMHTQLLYVPIEFMSYLAYEYKNNGVGRSLLEKTKSIASLRMVNLMADSIAAVKNAINHKDVDIVLDPNDPDPMKTVEQHLDEFMKATSAEFPIGMLNFADITDSLKRAGVSVSVSGHPGVPETSMKVNYSAGGLTPPDRDFDERLQKRNIMALGIPPDSVNSATEMEFAKNVVTYNFLSAKINTLRQEITCEHVGDFMRKYTRNSSILIEQLTEIVEKNRQKIDAIKQTEKISSRDLALLFINYISISLPEPDTSKIETELENFNKYKDALDAFLQAFVSEEMLSSTIVGEEIGNAMTSLIPIIKGYFLRKYLAKHNIMPELFTLVTTGDMDNENFDIFEQHEGYVKSVLPAFRIFVIRMLQAGGKTDGIIGAAKEILSHIQGTPNEASSDMSSDDDSGSDDNGGGDDEFGMDDEFGEGDDANNDGGDGDDGTGDDDSDGNDDDDSDGDKKDDDDSDEDWLE